MFLLCVVIQNVYTYSVASRLYLRSNGFQMGCGISVFLLSYSPVENMCVLCD